MQLSKYGTRLFALFVGAFFVVLFLAGQASAQTTNDSASCVSQGYKWCQNSDGVSGWCSNSTTYQCPAFDSASCSAQSGTWCANTSGGTGWCATPPSTCPINDQATCTSQGRSWCTPQSGGTGWCTYSSTEKCPAYTETDCTAQSKTWCVSPGTAASTGWCTDSCPYSSTYQQDQQTQCSTANGKWCKNSDGATGWCSYGTTACPAYDSASSSAQSGEWCAYASSSGGWCATPPSSCPINDQATCTAKGRSWCTSQPSASGYTSSGWCTSSATEKCPAYTETDCKTQNGDWCPPSYSGGTGWCNSMPGSCPINDKATCEAKSRSWCTSQYGGSGWCTSTGMTCSGTYTPPSPTPTPYPTPTTPTTTPTPTPPPTPAPTFTWPNTQTDCETYSGLWCKNESSYSTSYTMLGWCNMATQKCPIASKPGYMTCWDNSQVRNDSICPAMPSNATDCKKRGYNWCTSTVSAYSSSSGWCSFNVCGATPTAGQMTCPDGLNSSATLTGCPKKAVPTPVPIPEPIYTQCPDGSRVVTGSSCAATYTCPNGSMVKSADQCPKEDEISTCLNKGNVWCKDPSGVKNGWCAPVGGCGQNIPPQPVPKPVEETNELVSASEVKQDKRNLTQELRNMERVFKPLKEQTLLARIIALREKVNSLTAASRTAYSEALQTIYNEMEGLRFEVEKQNLLQELKTMERVFKRLKDETMLAKIATVREEINKIVVVDVMTRKEEMSAIYDDMEDLRFALQDAQEEGRVSEPERDEKFQKQALRDMKNSVKQFERFLSSVDARVKKVEKQGVAIDPAVKDLVVKAKDLIARAKQAKTYDEVKEIMDELPELGENLNDALPRLEMLARLPEALKMINRRIAKVERAIKTTSATVKRLKIDAADEIQKMQALLAEAKEATAKLKTGSVEDADTFFEYIQESIMEKLDEALTTSQMIQTVANVKKYVNKVAADLKRFERRIVQLEKKEEDMSEARALLDEAKTYLEALRTAAAKKLNADVADEMIEYLASLFSLDDQLEQVLKLTAPDALEKQLRRLFEGAPKGQLKSFEVGKLEKIMVKAYQTANFFRMTPNRSMAIIAE